MGASVKLLRVRWLLCVLNFITDHLPFTKHLLEGLMNHSPRSWWREASEKEQQDLFQDNSAKPVKWSDLASMPIPPAESYLLSYWTGDGYHILTRYEKGVYTELNRHLCPAADGQCPADFMQCGIEIHTGNV